MASVNYETKFTFLDNLVLMDESIQKTFCEKQKYVNYAMCINFDKINFFDKIDENWFGANDMVDGIFVALCVLNKFDVFKAKSNCNFFNKSQILSSVCLTKCFQTNVI
ncbi:hypothetical protein EIN_020150 [Entamoeba invadens IP1]|uniref:hypothetical protein n=1 Tax=Entamoeba invadens IP1 TaxID=370355 RepID=UPI0002C3DB36|nr:hypothetical protein EIN_020150 [Entamoeba invadens IP1]ELP90566.1 hypothetical protein EIN_020150 [Entamoeba invadens IP1]|eukprot:XP_004257337.1 hypothetical protein EIN_020150 [Entamoeba invadens IP1]